MITNFHSSIPRVENRNDNAAEFASKGMLLLSKAYSHLAWGLASILGGRYDELGL